MKLSAGQKKWGKRILIFLVMRFVITGILYYLITYRFKDIMQYVVKRESKGVYAFNASDIQVSLWNKNIVLNNSTLDCNDTIHTSPHYDVKIPRVYLAVQSWKDLILHRRLSVDSLAIVLPEVKAHEHEQQHNTAKVSFNASTITGMLEKLLVHLQVRSFNLQNGAFAFGSRHSPATLSTSRINLVISNFAKTNITGNHLFASDDVDLSLDNQHWTMPDGKHDISFKRLHFSGKNQFFELDSCTFHAAAVDGKGEMSLSAEKFFFNSKQLSSIYEKESLLVDTLICFKPVLNVITNSQKNKSDTAINVSAQVQQLFKNINFKYIDIREGQLVMANKYAPNYNTQKANLKIYNLGINAGGKPGIKADSMQLSLHNIQFLTTDSMFKMDVAELSIDNKDIIFKNAAYGPTIFNRSGKGITFTTPSLRLKKISLENLLNKKLVAEEAELNHPLITVFDKGTTKATIRAKTVKDSAADINRFYTTLHGLHELIAVKDFHIVNGNMHFKAKGAGKVKMTMKNLYAHVLLDHFLTSDSLIDIKRSLPQLKVAEMTIQSKALNVQVKNYSFDGLRRHNTMDEFQLSLANGTLLTGKQIYWEILDWDLYQQFKLIQIDALKIHELAVNIPGGNNNKSNKPAEVKNLPAIRLGRLDIDNLAFNSNASTSSLHFDAQNICTDNVASVKQFFTWKNAEALLSNISFTGKNTQASVEKVNFTNTNESRIENTALTLTADSGTTSLHFPVLKINTTINSTDFSKVHLNSLTSDDASVDIHSTANTVNTNNADKKVKPVNIPLNFTADKFIISNAAVNYLHRQQKDTLTFTASINVNAKALHSFKNSDKLFTYEKAVVDVNNLQLSHGPLVLAIPASSIDLSKGVADKTAKGISFVSGILLKWTDVNAQLQKGDSFQLSVKKLSGNFKDNQFSLNPSTKLLLLPLIKQTTINEGSVYLKEKTVTVNVGALSWDPQPKTLTVKNFDITPNLSMQETFKRAKWQGDYMLIKGDAITIKGIDYKKDANDSALVIRKILLDKVSLITSRDKLMPSQHGIEKPMPTKLINTIKFPLQVDSVIVQESTVTVKETSPATKKWGTIPLVGINAIVTNIKSRTNANDSLTIVADAKMVNNNIRSFYYQESYGDSLSYFNMHSNVAPMLLPNFSQVTIPMTAISVDRGNSDTLFANWSGNKYAAIGAMNLYYKHLKVSLLNKQDSAKKNFLLSIANLLANNLVLRRNNDNSSVMFFERDRESFIFNYWIKTELKGILSSIGIKSSKKYLKQYRNIKVKYSLPEMPKKTN